MLFAILLTIQIIVSVSMAGLILIQRSEGGALGMGGGGGGGFMSARGAGNLLTRATAILAFIFFANSIGLTIVGNFSTRQTSAVDKVDTSGLTVNTSNQPTAPAAQTSTSTAPSLSDLPLAGASAPVASSTAPTAPALNSKPAVLPAPLKLPASSSASSSVSAKQVEKAKESIWASSSSASPKAPAASSAATPSSAATSSASK
ncbi:preprotein translocase subunit SecG [Asticcacaulis taihuensis]|jgi:preprotein translocase subunit SecG|uniref:preprotein translocase subunit SecG n=1 Tax=Asticcacaulis taihuensis TaxID=260084 RepID=UPI0026ED3964|nr:preprotein translocase subunit SecG [Asticcacaulis taihuensis]